MKTPCIALCALLLSALAPPASAVGAAIHIGPANPATVDLGFFYDELAPYGHWMETPQLGWAWAPTVDATWRPYAAGQWAPSDSGWTWLSDEPFGWATYHYGRWNHDPDYGWMWVPGNEWAPAWVSWRASEDAIGWAPLPPSYAFRPEHSLQVVDVGLPPEAYLFVPERDLLRPRVLNFALPPGQARQFFRSTRNFTRYRRFNDLIVNEGVPFDRIQRRIGRPVPRYRLVDFGPGRWRRPMRMAGNRIGVFRPAIRRGMVAPPPARRLARRSVMTVADAVRTRRMVSAARAADHGRRPEIRRLAVRPAHGVGHGLSRQVQVRRQGVRLHREVHPSHVRKVEPRRHGRLSRAAPSRETRVRQRHFTRSGPRVSTRSRSHVSRHAFRQRQPRSQHQMRPDRHGGRRSAMGAMGRPGGRQGGHHGGGRRGRGH